MADRIRRAAVTPEAPDPGPRDIVCWLVARGSGTRPKKKTDDKW